MKRQQAFEPLAEGEGMLKGGLHCHTTRSDGAVEPGDVIRCYYDNGYDFVALTDHRRYNYVNYAPELPITILPGMEFDNVIEREEQAFRCFHTVCIGPAKEDGNGYEHDERFPSGTAKNQEEYQAYLDEIHAKNNLTVYCHPQWSSTPARYFEKMEGDFAMEIWNSESAIACDIDKDAAYWDELLEQGKVIYGVASDDGHIMKSYGLGWVRVRSENNVNAILDALREGKFYSSCGPEIFDFYVDDEGNAVVKCSPARRIRFHCDRRPTYSCDAKDESLTERAFRVPKGCKYVRVVVIDADGKYAWTNPIFLD